MLYIEKKNPPRAYLVAVAKIKSAPSWQRVQNGNTKSIRNHFDLLPKSEIRKALLVEQHHLCAYCMKHIQDEERHTSIEHWFPLSKDKARALSYGNFLMVCKGGEDVVGAKSRPLCCDASKGNQTELTVNPFDKDMMQLIAYTKAGTIYCLEHPGFDTKKINEDINKVLRLNGKIGRDGSRIDTATELVKGRRDAYNGVCDIIKKLDKKKQLTPSNIRKIIQKIEQSEDFPEFAGTTLFFLKRKLKYLESQRR